MSSKPASATQQIADQKSRREGEAGQMEVSAELTSIWFGNKTCLPGTVLLYIAARLQPRCPSDIQRQAPLIFSNVKLL